ncbi:enoyl-CoA hydratase/isomerase family protein [Leptodontidium sp. MPI-SDFR-AT-0119]|nr:enoyl-CoA hydratase/isomerase family protein [Leptodontidium sp. MPI-SDFR-AT-0119]
MFSPIHLQLVLTTIVSFTSALELPQYKALLTSQEKPGILEVTFHFPNTTINLWNQAAADDMTDLVSKLQVDNETKVVVFKSDVPKYFIAHADLGFSLDNPTIINQTIELSYNLTNLPQTTIALVEGVCRGSGNEFLMAFDMRFATKTHTFFGQPEVGIGFIPGVGGIQWMTANVNRGFLMEYMLSGKDINAQDAERIGWINKAFDNSAEMNGYVASLTSRLALFPLDAISAGKQAINVATRPSLQSLLNDSEAFLKLFRQPEVQARTKLSVPVDGDGERFFGENLPLLYGAPA